MTDQSINLVLITNPLTPIESRQISTRPWDGKPLSEHLPELHGEWAISTSRLGNISKEDLATIIVEPGEFVVMAPVLQGGGDTGKTVMRLVALVAITYLTWGVGTGAIGAGMGLSTTAGSAGIGFLSSAGLAAVGLQVGGMLLVNAILPPSAAESGNNGKATYGYDGPKTTSTEGIVVPIVAGEHWIGGNAISTFVDNMGDDQQYLNMLLTLGEGRFQSYEEILINEQPIENFTNLSVDFRSGTLDQSVIPWFNDIYTPINRNVKLPAFDLGDSRSDSYIKNYLKNGTPGTDFLVHTTTGPADAVRLDFTLPTGQGKNQEDGLDSLTVHMWIGYREVGTSGDFIPLGINYVAKPASDYEKVDIGGGVYEYTRSDAIYPDDVSPPGMIATFPKKQTTHVVRRSFVTGELDKTKRYEFRMVNQNDDFTDAPKVKANRVIYLADVNEILRDDIRYKYTAVLGMRILMSDQLNSIPSVLVRVKGILCDYYDGTTGTIKQAWSDNPAWITYTCLTNTRWGGGIDPNRIKMDHFRQWAAFCFLNGFKFNGVIPDSSNIIDALKPVFKAGRASPVRLGTKIGVSVEEPRTMSALFGSGNIVKGSLKINWSSLSERANQVEASYYDIEEYNKKKTIIIENPAARLRGDDPRPSPLDLRGVTTKEQASREAMFALNMNALTRSVVFDAPIESITMSLGEVFGISHDMPEWGMSGRTKSGSTTSNIKLDREVTMETGKSYQLMIRHDSSVLVSGTVTQIQGYAVYLTNFNPYNTAQIGITRLVIGGVDREIIEVLAQSGGHYGVLLSDAAGIAVSNPFDMVAIDYIETKNVVLDVGQTDTVVLTSSLKSAPPIYTNFAFGEVNKVVTQYTCRSISGDGEHNRTIGGLEYNPAVFEDAVINIPIVTVPSDALIENVVFNGFSAAIFKSEEVYRYKVTARFESPDPGYDHAEVWVAINGNPYIYMGDGKTDYTVIASFLDVIDMKLVPVNRWGKKPFLENVDVHTYTIDDTAGRVLTAPINLTATPGGEYIYLDWTPATLDEDGNVIADADRPAVFKIYAEDLGLIENAPESSPGVIDEAALTSIDWTPGGFPTAAITASTYFNYSGLTPLSIYRIWVQEIHPHYPDVTSGVAPDNNGLLVYTTASDLTTFEDLFPEGIKNIHFSTELTEYYAAEIIAKLDEIAAVVDQNLIDLGVAQDENNLAKARITTVEAELASPSTGTTAMSTAIQGLLTNATEVDGVLTTFASDITVLQSGLADAEGDIIAQADATDILDTRVTSAEGTITAQANDIVSLEAVVAGITNEGSAAAIAAMDVRVTQNEDDIEVNTSDLVSLNAVINGPGGNVANAAAISSLSANVSLLDGQVTSMAGQYTSLSTTVGSYSTSISTLTASVNGIKAEWTIAIDNNGRVSGIQLLSGANETTSFNVNADVFKISSPSDPNKQVFAVDSRDNKTYIAENIVGIIKSKNYVWLTSGFGIDGVTGNAEFHNILARGNIEATSIKVGTLNVVDTLMIQGQAVSVPIGVNGTTRVMTASDQVLATSSVNPAGGKIQARFTCTVEWSGDWSATITIIVGGVTQQVRPFWLRSNSGTINTSLPLLVEWSSSSTYSSSQTIQVVAKWGNAYGKPTLKDCYLTLTGLKR